MLNGRLWVLEVLSRRSAPAICTTFKLEIDHEHTDPSCRNHPLCIHTTCRRCNVLLVALAPGASQDMSPNAILEAQPIAGLYCF